MTSVFRFAVMGKRLVLTPLKGAEESDNPDVFAA
jgi:hypothetical protein